ncbi:dephospho-CoA kinase [Odoribacter lunatus]|uniref:dephospho-CoA kinase n=1 Tax=Odoribacter lunatus TaxID=2941335 RepID=UPI00203AF887|nr:dephospho-CoA kinase [Odoribacter lunatus]
METTVFNPAQLQLLKMMSFVKTSEALDQLKQVISDFFAKQAQEEINHLWETGELNDEKIESFRQLHERTPYK